MTGRPNNQTSSSMSFQRLDDIIMTSPHSIPHNPSRPSHSAHSLTFSCNIHTNNSSPSASSDAMAQSSSASRADLACSPTPSLICTWCPVRGHWIFIHPPCVVQALILIFHFLLTLHLFFNWTGYLGPLLTWPETSCWLLNHCPQFQGRQKVKVDVAGSIVCGQLSCVLYILRNKISQNLKIFYWLDKIRCWGVLCKLQEIWWVAPTLFKHFWSFGGPGGR